MSQRFYAEYDMNESIIKVSLYPLPFSHSVTLSLNYTLLHLLCMPREHRVQDGKVVFPLGVSIQGDVVVSVYHMRSTIGGRLQAKVRFCLVCFIR